MIGYQILATEQIDGTFICDKVSSSFSIQIEMTKVLHQEELPKEAERLYNTQDGSNKDEFTLSIEELVEISKATNCITPSREGYHELACDGIIVIPKSKDNFISIKEYITQ
jgi:hypothetical protein